MPIHPPTTPGAEQLVWSARLRAAADDVHDVSRTLLRRQDDAGLVGPAGDALQVLTGEMSRDLAACAEAVAAVGGALLLVDRA